MVKLVRMIRHLHQGYHLAIKITPCVARLRVTGGAHSSRVIESEELSANLTKYTEVAWHTEGCLDHYPAAAR